MPATLNQDILANVCRKLLKDDKFDAECLNKFALAGKESLEAFEAVIASAKSVYIYGDTFLLKMSDNDKTYLAHKPSQIATARLLKVIGSCTKRIAFTDVGPSTLPIIEAVCNAKKLTKIAFVDDFLIDQNVIPFWRILEECHASLSKIVVPAQYYFSHNPPVFHLQTLYFKSEEDNILPYLNNPSCVANELIIELKEQEGNSTDRWEMLSSCLREFNNPALSNLKKLKLKLHIEEYIDFALTILLQAVSSRFPALQSFTLINQLTLNEYCHTFQDFINHYRYYSPIFTELDADNFNFAVELEWNLKYNIDEKMFIPHYSDICREIFKNFDSEMEDRNTLVLFKNDELSPAKSISFEVKVYNENTANE